MAVNRYWQWFFGTGLVKTVDDFGTQGELPSHPELLDWLATEFQRTGWDVKRLQRTIVTSATYRQSSAVTPEQLRRDPENRLLARAPRQRLSAETIRDVALAASGLLVERIGGPSVKPYQPPRLWLDLTGNVDYEQDHGADLYRRSIYTFVKRTVAPPTMITFDSSPRETCTVRTTRTNTPLQALALMNDVTFVEAARALAERVENEAAPEPGERIARAFRLVLSRPPSPAELETLLRNLVPVVGRTFASIRMQAEWLVKSGEAGRAKPQVRRVRVSGVHCRVQLDHESRRSDHQGVRRGSVCRTATGFRAWIAAAPVAAWAAMGVGAVARFRAGGRAGIAAHGQRDAGFRRAATGTKRVAPFPAAGEARDLSVSVEVPSQMDLFSITSRNSIACAGTELPDSIRQGQRLTGMTSSCSAAFRWPVARFASRNMARAAA